MKFSATLWTLCLGMHMSAAAPINSTTQGITVDNTHSANHNNSTGADIELIERDGTNWEWWCDWWWEPICGGQPPPGALNVPFNATTGEVINTTTAQIFTELSRVTPVERHHPSFWEGDPCCLTVFCHRKKECDIPEWDTSKYNYRCGWCWNPIPPPPNDI